MTKLCRFNATMLLTSNDLLPTWNKCSMATMHLFFGEDGGANDGGAEAPRERAMKVLPRQCGLRGYARAD